MPVACSGVSGVMKRVKTVRSGKRSAMRVTVGSTRSIHGVGHGPSVEKMRCMSTHRWTERAVSGPPGSSPILPYLRLFSIARGVTVVTRRGLLPGVLQPAVLPQPPVEPAAQSGDDREHDEVPV